MSELICHNCHEPLDQDMTHCPACGYAVNRNAGGLRRSVVSYLAITGILVAVAVVFLLYQSSGSKAADVQHSTGSMAGDAMTQEDITALMGDLPDDYSSLVSMGNALMDQNNYQVAAACYTKALTVQPDAPDILVDLGTCQHSLGMNEQAEASFLKALEIDPSHKIAKFNLGVVYLHSGQIDKALLWWKTLLKEGPPPELKDQLESLVKDLESES